jgi:hypothetical protein
MAVVPMIAACGSDHPAGAPPDAPPDASLDAPGEAAPNDRTPEVDASGSVDASAESSAPSTDDASPLDDTATDVAGGEDAVVEADAAPPPPPGPYPRPDYQHLVETGLFDDIAAKQVTSDAVLFEPTYKLWSDAAAKRRWILLPAGTQIDTSDMDHWVFPIGTKFWKEFSLDGGLLETRLIERYGTGPDDYWMGAFVWNADGTDAVLAADGQMNINGTAHDAPAQKDCGACHRGDIGRVLGFSAIQMSRDSQPPNLRDLAARGWLSAPPDAGIDYPVPGDAVTSAALGYLHANCGHCHNENGTAWPDTQMVLRLLIADRDAVTSGVFTSIVGKSIQYWRGGAVTLRVAPGNPDMSGIVVRMSARGNKDQMPQLATEIVDPTGIQAVRDWITSLSPPSDAGDAGME